MVVGRNEIKHISLYTSFIYYKVQILYIYILYIYTYLNIYMYTYVSAMVKGGSFREIAGEREEVTRKLW